jgi:hypothetical protein
MEKFTWNMYTHTCMHTSSQTLPKNKTEIEISNLSDLKGEVYQTH